MDENRELEREVDAIIAAG
jgi:hypothetical protein